MGGQRGGPSRKWGAMAPLESPLRRPWWWVNKYVMLGVYMFADFEKPENIYHSSESVVVTEWRYHICSRRIQRDHATFLSLK